MHARTVDKIRTLYILDWKHFKNENLNPKIVIESIILFKTIGLITCPCRRN